jgi:hypothetical protein
VPSYDLQRVRDLIRHLESTDRLLLLRAVAPDGRRVASGIVLAFNKTAYFWGGASVRDQQLKKLRPNEAIFWFAMRWAREKGCSELDTCGGGQYKTRYGGPELRVPRFRCSRIPLLGSLRNTAAVLVDTGMALRGRRDTLLARLRPGSDRAAAPASGAGEVTRVGE